MMSESKNNKKILVIEEVEDDASLRSVLHDKFALEGFSVLEAKDGEEAIRAIKKSRPDLVLLDLIMPRKDGFEVLKEIRDNPELKNLSVLVLSNLGGEDDIKKALALGSQ